LGWPSDAGHCGRGPATAHSRVFATIPRSETRMRPVERHDCALTDVLPTGFHGLQEHGSAGFGNEWFTTQENDAGGGFHRVRKNWGKSRPFVSRTKSCLRA